MEDVKPRLAFGPLRVAVTGRQVSRLLFESMEIGAIPACPLRASWPDRAPGPGSSLSWWTREAGSCRLEEPRCGGVEGG